MSTILVDGVETEIGDKPLTLVCHKGDVHLAPLAQCEIGPEQTMARAARIEPEEWAAMRADPAFQKLFGIIFPDMDLAKMPTSLQREGAGVRHITGMIVMLGEMAPGQSPYLRFPESFLHPSAQSRLGDLFILLSGAGKQGQAR